MHGGFIINFKSQSFIGECAMKIKDMRSEDKPRERFAISPKNARMADLIAILLRTGRQGRSVLEIAEDVIDELERFTDVSMFDDLDWRDLVHIDGIGKDKAITLCAAIELGRRLSSRFLKTELKNFGNPSNVAKYFMEELRHKNQEHFLVCYLNIKNKLLGYREITRGGLQETVVDIKEALKWALRFKAYAIILVHNHPSGVPDPSREDIRTTERFVKAGKILDIVVLDHIIIGDGNFKSLAEMGYV